MKITIRDPIVSVGITLVQPGDFFRFANGKDTETAFIALYHQDEGRYNRCLICRELNTNTLRKLYVNTRKERQINFLNPEEIIFRDTMPPANVQVPLDDDEKPDVQ